MAIDGSQKLNWKIIFPNSNIKVALTEKGFLFFIFPEIDSAKYLMFIDGKWIEKQSPQTD